MPPHGPPHFPASLKTTVAGLDFPTPVGLAAGFDKDAEVAEQMLSLGFGFVEVGTLTPQPQDGNPKPRLFRLREDRAVINRLGFNNHGQPAAFDRLERFSHLPGIIGVNIGANKDSRDRIADYAAGVKAMATVADYLTINVSSPNTPGLRQLQDEGALRALALKPLRDFRSASGGQSPLIGVGGIATADDAWERIRAGASLVQLYSAMVYQGPGIAARIARGLAQRLNREGFANIADAVGTE